MRATRAALLLLVGFLAGPSLALAQEDSAATLELTPSRVRIPAGGGVNVTALLRNVGPVDVHVEVPSLDALPPGLTYTALEGPGGVGPEGDPLAWRVAPGETKEFQLLLSSERGVVRSNASLRVLVRFATDQPPAQATLEILVLSPFGGPARPSGLLAVPPGAWAALAGIVAVGGLFALVRSDAGRVWWAGLGRGPPADPEAERRILALVAASPGLGFEELRRASGLEASTLVRQLDALGARGALRVRRDGLRRRYYLSTKSFQSA